MNAVLLIAHAPLASALRDAALHVLPDAAPDLMALDVFPDQAPERGVEVARELLTQRAPGSVLILADVLGATPCNIASELMAAQGAPVLAGVNLPMVLRALNYRAEPIATMAQRALAGGTRGVLALGADAVSEPGAGACHEAQ